MSSVVRVLVLAAIWLGLWSDISFANALSGLVVGAAIVLAFGTRQQGNLAIRPVRVACFAGYFLFKLVQSSITVARAVLAPCRAVHTGIVNVPLLGCSDRVATLIADAISLTPGTLTLEIQHEPLVLFVHALDVRDVEQVRSDVRRLEVLAVRAFGDADAIAGLTVDDTTARRAR